MGGSRKMEVGRRRGRGLRGVKMTKREWGLKARRSLISPAPPLTSHACLPFTSKAVMTSPGERGHIKETKIDAASKTLAALRLAVLQAKCCLFLIASEAPPVALPHTQAQTRITSGGTELQPKAKSVHILSQRLVRPRIDSDLEKQQRQQHVSQISGAFFLPSSSLSDFRREG